VEQWWNDDRRGKLKKKRRKSSRNPATVALSLQQITEEVIWF
jgi:hypothetical protein